MDAPCKIQRSIHVFRLVNNMCPGKWVHIRMRELFNRYKKAPLRVLLFVVERAKGIEPSSQAWEARILPMNYARV